MFVSGAQVVLSEENEDKLINELQELMAEMNQAIANGNIEEGLAYYADDAVVLPNHAPRIVGKAELRKKMLKQKKSGVDFGSFMGTVERAWESNGMVYSVGSYALSANVPGRPRPVGDKGKFFAVFRREPDGTLKIVYDIWNTDIEYGK